jgi:S1-C subfamily serine protease
MTDVKIALADKREFEAEILLRDPRTDLAVLKIKGLKERLTPLELGDSDKLEVGDLVLALGNPFGVGQTVTQGIVSALARSQVGVGDYQSFIQTDAAINPGNSGGALVDMAGRLVGINTSIFSKSGGSHGIGFAIPVGMVKVVLTSAKAGSKVVRRPWIGMKTESVTAEIAENLGLPRPAGVLINFVRPASPAEKAGLKSGDVITAIDGIAVDEPDAFGYRLAIRPAGVVTALTLLRGTKAISLNLTTQSAPIGPADLTLLKGDSPLKGASVQTISPSLEEELGIDIPDNGVVIVSVEGVALQTGLQKGDVVLTLNGEAITSPAVLDKITSARQRLWRFEINRGGQILRSTFGG